MKTRLTLLIVVCFQSLIAQNYNWPTIVTRTVPDSLKTEDAVYLDNVTTIDFKQHNETSIVYFKRIKLLTKKGVEDFSERELYQFNNGYIAMKKARVIKPSGDIIDLGDEHVKETFMEEKQNREKFYLKRIQLLFPNLEIGDVIDVVYQVDYDRNLLSKSIFLEADLVSLNSRLTLRNFSTFELNIYPTKGMGDVTSSNEGNMPSFSWNKTNVPKQTESYFSCPSPTASRVTYMLWYPGKRLTYDDVYKMDIENYSLQIGFKNITPSLVKRGVISNQEDPFVGLLELMDYLKNSFTWVEGSEVSSTVKTIDYFLKSVVNDDLYFRYIQTYLEENKRTYQIGYTRSLLEGPFQHGYVTFDQLERRFLVIEDGSGNPHYVFPPNAKDKFYYLDEIPYYCEGNDAILLAGDNVVLKQIIPTKLPLSLITDNKHTCNLLVKVKNHTIDSLVAKRTDVFSGHYSYLLRGKTQRSWLKDLAVADTTLTATELGMVYPYNQTFKQETVLNDCINQIEDSLHWFKPESVLPKGVYTEDESQEVTPEYAILPFLKQDKYSIYLESETPIVLAESKKTFTFSNEIGTITMEAIQSNATTIKFIYELKINERMLSDVAKNKAFHELQQTWYSYRTKKWIFKI